MTITQKGIEPPPKADIGIEDLVAAKMEKFRGYINNLDKWFRLLSDKVPKVQTTALTINPASVAANNTSEQMFVVFGVTLNDIVTVNKPTHTAGLGIVGCRASAVDELAITFMNCTGLSIDPPQETYVLVATRR